MSTRNFNSDQTKKLNQVINEGMQVMHEIETLTGGLNDTIKAIAEELEIKFIELLLSVFAFAHERVDEGRADVIEHRAARASKHAKLRAQAHHNLLIVCDPPTHDPSKECLLLRTAVRHTECHLRNAGRLEHAHEAEYRILRFIGRGTPEGSDVQLVLRNKGLFRTRRRLVEKVLEMLDVLELVEHLLVQLLVRDDLLGRVGGHCNLRVDTVKLRAQASQLGGARVVLVDVNVGRCLADSRTADSRTAE